MDINQPLRIVDCPLCRIFSHKEVITKLYWPERVEDIPDSEFVIVDCKSCKVPLIVLGEHLTDINRECWGRILYMTKKIFGKWVTLRLKTKTIRDHWHCHVYKKEY